MQELRVLKESKKPGTPLFLFECRCSATQVFYWSSHKAVVDGEVYEARVIEHSSLEFRMATGEESSLIPRILIRLANADQALSALTTERLWKGADITIRFVLYDLESDSQLCEPILMLRGTINAPDEVDYRSIRLSVLNRLGAYRSHLPAMRIQKRCAWLFPRTEEERSVAALSDGEARYSPFHGCGYSPDISGGVGDLSPSGPFTSCNYTKSDCVVRGMYDRDMSLRATRRFAGFQFIPAARLVRGYGEKHSAMSTPSATDSTALELVPIAYGTVWTDGIVTISQSDGNLIRMEAVLCSGPIAGVVKVIVDGVEIPAGEPGRDMNATGWYNVVTLGGRSGSFNMDFRNESGEPVGDPNGGIAVLSIIVPSTLGRRVGNASIQVLVQGAILPTYNNAGVYSGDSFTSNPAWVLLDVMRRAGYREEELDLGSFAAAAIQCSELVVTVDSSGNEIVSPRSECNVLLRTKRPVSEIVRGIQAGSEISIRYNVSGKMEAFVEASIADQHPTLPYGSNAQAPLDGGWPAYEFGDGTAGSYGILLTERGEPTLELFSKSHAETPNRVTIEYIDPNNDYVSDVYSLIDLDDIVRVGQEIGTKAGAVGVSGQAQANRVCRKHLAKNLDGNLFVEFETTIKAIFLRPGDIITINVPNAGLVRRPFRIVSVAPSFNGERVRIRAQIHFDAWYTALQGGLYQPGAGCNACIAGEPRPLLGDVVDANGEPVYSVIEESVEAADHSQIVRLRVGFRVPARGSGALDSRPQVSLIPVLLAGSGSIDGERNLYYAVTEVDAQGHESLVSSTIHAYVPAGLSGAAVQLTGIRSSPLATAFNIYRGEDPWRLRGIASIVPVNVTYTDPGLPLLPFGPPDPHFVKARFEWRSEYLPPLAVSFADESSVTVSGLELVPDSLVGKVIRVESGKGEGQERTISANTTSRISVMSLWNQPPDASSEVSILEAGWNHAGESSTSPISFEIPNQSGSVIHIRGYGLNGSGEQSRKDLADTVRHVVGGAHGPDQDVDVPDTPTFGLSATGRGLIEIGGIGFNDLSNVASISSGTLQVHFLNELDLVPATALAVPVTSSTEILQTVDPVSFSAGSMIVVEGELMRIVNSTSSSTVCDVERGVYDTIAADHGAAAELFPLERRLAVFAVPRQFFGSPGSGDFSYSLPMANSRVVAADLLFTNSRGNSGAGQVNYCSLVDGGLRVLTGGQISVQVGGYLAIQTPAAPAIVVEGDHAIRDIFGVVKEPPMGDPLVVRVNRDSEELCLLTIDAGTTISNIVSGVNIPALLSMEQVSVDIISVGQGAFTLPGRDLTVTIRL